MATGDYSEPVELNNFYIPGGMGRLIKDLIRPMLDPAPVHRPTPAQLITAWRDLF